MLEKKLLSYNKGITNSPSDLTCTDGELSECVNLEVKNGELVPMEMPVKMDVYMDEGEKLLLVHNIKTSGKNYFTLRDGVLRSFHIEDISKVYYSLSVNCGEIRSIQAIGNTVVAYSNTSPHYMIYTDGMYKYLGSSLPTLGLSFNLEGTMVVSETFDVDVPALDDGDDDTADSPDMSTDENKEKATNQIISKVNKFIAEESEEKGLFIYPFLVRYAYRLFDGSYVMHSSPVLMMPSTTLAPLCGYVARQDKRPPFKTFVAAVVSKLTAKADNLSFRFGEWSDVISSVSIFVSTQFRTYDQEGSIESFSYMTKQTPSTNTVFYGTLKSKGLNKKYPLYYNLGSDFTTETGEPTSFCFWDLPTRDSGDIMEEIAGCSLFYKYASYSPEYIDSHSSFVINPEDTGVNPVLGIELNETLPDDYMTHDVLIPESSFVYNGRLNISNIERHLFKGYSAAALSQVGINGDNIGYYHIYTYIKTLNGTVIVKSPAASSMVYDMYGVYLFYPDTDAYRMVIHDTNLDRYAIVPLSEHSGLNGAYYFDGFKDLMFQYGTPDVAETASDVEYLPNKLFTSDVNNPFRFPLAGINTIGSGEILGISAVTRPISQGQFGEYPLIAFCSDGNFALKVDSEGFYSGISPVQEDVVLGGDKITPMENSVVIITKKGIMITSGNDMSQLAIQLDGASFNHIVLENIGTKSEELAMLVTNSASEEGFLQYLYGSRMAFDYSSDRLFIYNPAKPFFYVYHFSNGTVNKAMFDGVGIVGSVIDYPDTIIQDGNGNLYSVYGKEDVNMNTECQYGFALTRPLKLDTAMYMKSIRQIRNAYSGLSDDSFVKYAIYGSNNNVDYFRIGSRFGKPYKYYRLAIYTHMLSKEALSGTVLTIEERRTHKLR